MNKNAGERTQGDLTVIVKAKEMCIHTLKVTNNEKYFPKRYRLSVVNKMHDKAFEIIACLIEANDISKDKRRIFVQKNETKTGYGILP